MMNETQTITLNTFSAFSLGLLLAISLAIELERATNAARVPAKIIRRWNSFSVTNKVKAHLHLTEHPDTLSASECCPGQLRA
jgi:hypothetical protein